MSKPIRITVIVIIVIAAIGLGYLLLGKTSNSPESATSPSPQVNSPAPAENVQQPSSAGSYSDYSAEAVATTQGQRILFFHAPWCPQCRQLDASIRSGSIPDDVTIFKVDYDSNQKLRQQHGITIQTTLVLLDDNGNTVKKYVAYDQPTLSAVVENLL